MELDPRYSIEAGKPGEACGLIGIYHPNLSGEKLVALAFTGMQALQHRGQTGAGIAVFNEEMLHIEKGNGLVTEALGQDKLRTLAYQSNSPTVIGHDRYTTSGLKDAKESERLAHPFGAKSGTWALGHNGTVSLDSLKSVAESLGIDTEGCGSDTEHIVFMLDEVAKDRGDLIEAMHMVLPRLEGAFNLVLNQPDTLIGVRDPRGYRPLSIGELDSGGIILASETIAFDTLGAKFVRDLVPGEIVIIDKDGMRSEMLDPNYEESFCMFEYIYFAHPNSHLLGKNVYRVRERLGQFMGIDNPVDVDMVVGVQNSGAPYARGYSHQTGIPEELAITKNAYIPRTFIQDTQMTREQSVELKHQPNSDLIEGKRVALVDDSIIRGTTMRSLVRSMYRAGATEVHVLIPSPPYISPCYYGMDTHNPDQLISHDRSIEETRQYIGSDSLAFLSLERVLEAIEGTPDTIDYISRLCVSCVTGNYPTEVPITLTSTPIRAQA